MKAKAKTKKAKKATSRQSSHGRKTGAPRKKIEDRGLNEDEQDQITNVDKDDDMAAANSSRSSGFTVEEEEEREKRRKVEDLHPEEPMK